MINISRKGALLGFGLLGVTVLGGIAQPASAQSRYNSRNDVVVVRERAGNWNKERREYRTIEGRVIQDLRGNDFLLRRDNGTTQRVRVMYNEPRRLSRNDRVRAYGFTARNGVFQAQSLTILRNR